MKRTILSALLCLTAWTAIPAFAHMMADDEALIKKLLDNGAAGNFVTPSALRLIFIGAGEEMLATVGGDESQAEELADKYASSRMMTDLASLLAPYLQKTGTTKAQLREYLAELETEECRIARAHYEESFNLQTSMETIVQQMLPVILGIMQGTEPAPIVATECTDRYKELFQTYYELTVGGDGVIGRIVGTLEARMPEGNESKVLIDKFATYMQDNYPVLVRNMLLKSVTAEDLVCLNRMSGQQGYKAFAAAFSAIEADGERFWQNWLEKYGTWLQGHL